MRGSRDTAAGISAKLFMSQKGRNKYRSSKSASYAVFQSGRSLRVTPRSSTTQRLEF